MKIKINGKKINIGDSLKFYAEEKIKTLLNKYSLNSIDTNVTFSKDKRDFLCDFSIHMSTGLTALSKSKSNDIHESFDNSINKVEKQLRRYKRRLKNHHIERREPITFKNEPAYVLSSINDDKVASEYESLQPVIIAEMETKISTMSVGEAVMQLDLMELKMLLFRNSSHNGINLVYLRDDGNIGWIDPSNLK